VSIFRVLYTVFLSWLHFVRNKLYIIVGLWVIFVDYVHDTTRLLGIQCALKCS